jgi:hypothetical protein
VRRELFQNVNQDVQRAALAVFAAVIRMLAGDSSGLSNEPQLVAFLEPVLSTRCWLSALLEEIEPHHRFVFSHTI